MLPRRVLDLAGQRFGKLVVVSFVRRKHGKTLWMCRCDCGADHLTAAHSLQRREVKSCGCVRIANIAGQRFGRLVAIDIAGKAHDRGVTWRCVCDCGRECIADGRYLRRGRTRSCGCLRVENIRNVRTLSPSYRKAA